MLANDYIDSNLDSAYALQIEVMYYASVAEATSYRLELLQMPLDPLLRLEYAARREVARRRAHDAEVVQGFG